MNFNGNAMQLLVMSVSSVLYERLDGYVNVYFLTACYDREMRCNEV